MSNVVGTIEIALRGDARSLNRTLSQAEGDIRSFGSRSESALTSVGRRMSLAITAPLLAAGGIVTSQAIQWESDFAGVRKTVNATAEELAVLSGELRTLATAGDSMVSGLAGAHTTLALIGELGGQLGVATGDIDDFVGTVGELTMSTNLGAEEAATWSAQLMNIMGLDIAENIRPMGDAVVNLGNNMATTERDIMQFAQRLAGAGASADVPIEKVLALGAAAASVGLRAESAGTSMTRIMMDMQTAAASAGSGMVSAANLAESGLATYNSLAQDRLVLERQLEEAQYSLQRAQERGVPTGNELNRLDELNAALAENAAKMTDAQGTYQNFAGMGNAMIPFEEGSEMLRLFADTFQMTTTETADLISTDMYGAVQQFMRAFNQLGDSERAKILEDLGWDTIRVSDLIRRMSGDTDLLEQALMHIGETADGALGTEAQKRFETTEAQINRLKNNFRNLGITLGNVMLPPLAKSAGVAADFVGHLAAMDEKSARWVVTISGIAAAIGPVLVVLGKLKGILAAIGFGPVGILAAGAAVAIGAVSYKIAEVVANSEPLQNSLHRIKRRFELVWEAATDVKREFGILVKTVWLLINPFQNAGTGAAFLEDKLLAVFTWIEKSTSAVYRFLRPLDEMIADFKLLAMAEIMTFDAAAFTADIEQSLQTALKEVEIETVTFATRIGNELLGTVEEDQTLLGLSQILETRIRAALKNITVANIHATFVEIWKLVVQEFTSVIKAIQFEKELDIGIADKIAYIFEKISGIDFPKEISGIMDKIGAAIKTFFLRINIAEDSQIASVLANIVRGIGFLGAVLRGVNPIISIFIGVAFNLVGRLDELGQSIREFLANAGEGDYTGFLLIAGFIAHGVGQITGAISKTIADFLIDTLPELGTTLATFGTAITTLIMGVDQTGVTRLESLGAFFESLEGLTIQTFTSITAGLFTLAAGLLEAVGVDTTNLRNFIDDIRTVPALLEGLGWQIEQIGLLLNLKMSKIFSDLSVTVKTKILELLVVADQALQAAGIESPFAELVTDWAADLANEQAINAVEEGLHALFMGADPNKYLKSAFEEGAVPIDFMGQQMRIPVTPEDIQIPEQLAPGIINKLQDELAAETENSALAETILSRMFGPEQIAALESSQLNLEPTPIPLNLTTDEGSTIGMAENLMSGFMAYTAEHPLNLVDVPANITNEMMNANEMFADTQHQLQTTFDGTRMQLDAIADMNLHILSAHVTLSDSAQADLGAGMGRADSHQTGGIAAYTGLHYLHKGEEVLTRNETQAKNRRSTGNTVIIQGVQDVDGLLSELERRGIYLR